MHRLDGILGAVPQYLLMLQSQYWPEDKLSRYVEKHLRATLAAARGVPFYRERFGSEMLLSPELSKFPILPRHEIPQLAASVRALHSDSSLLASGLTSGSTGNPVSFFYDATHHARAVVREQISFSYFGSREAGRRAPRDGSRIPLFVSGESRRPRANFRSARRAPAVSAQDFLRLRGARGFAARAYPPRVRSWRIGQLRLDRSISRL